MPTPHVVPVQPNTSAASTSAGSANTTAGRSDIGCSSGRVSDCAGSGAPMYAAVSHAPSSAEMSSAWNGSIHRHQRPGSATPVAPVTSDAGTYDAGRGDMALRSRDARPAAVTGRDVDDRRARHVRLRETERDGAVGPSAHLHALRVADDVREAGRRQRRRRRRGQQHRGSAPRVVAVDGRGPLLLLRAELGLGAEPFPALARRATRCARCRRARGHRRDGACARRAPLRSPASRGVPPARRGPGTRRAAPRS